MIETERLILRAPEPADLDWQLAWLNTPAVMRFLGGGARPADQVAEGFARNAEAMERGEPAFWTVVLRADRTVIGKCGLSLISEALAPPAIRGGVQVGWSLAEPFWGKGYASEAARAAIDQGFAAYDVPEIWAQTSDSNAASSRMMTRLGLKRCADYAYRDPDYPPADNPTTVYRVSRAEWDETR